ncbi:MAG: hypothetical protein R3A44_06715 [Caldilineaceae bacterium]
MLLHPAYKLTLGDKIIDTTDEPQASTISGLTVTLDMDAPADSFTLIMGQVGSFRPQRQDDAAIELGFSDGELTQVMTGIIVNTEPGLVQRRVVGHSRAEKLLHTFVNQTYEAKTAGQIVTDLADKAGVDVASDQPGSQFQAYVVDGRRSVYHHMRELAELCGFDLYINAAGELVFEMFVGGKSIHIFKYAVQIIELEIDQTEPFVGAVQAWGESAGGTQATEDWAWLTKNFDGRKGAAGTGQPSLLLERPALRNADAAQAAAAALNTRIQRRTVRGKLLVQGQPKVKLGDAIQLQDVPDASLNQLYQVRSVTHRITKAGGFTTQIGFRSIG